MAKKKNNPKKATPQETVLDKIAVKVGRLAGELVAGKNHLVEMAEEKIDLVKSTIQNITAKKKAIPKKAVKAKAKKAAVKSASAAVKKSSRPATKKASPVKKATKKVAKKASAKK